MLNLLQTIIPLPIDTSGGGDPDYLIGVYIAINAILIFLYMVRLCQWIVIGRKDGQAFFDYMTDEVSWTYLVTLLFVILNILAIAVGLSVWVTETFIKTN